jgi:hypothetical protein
MDVSKQIVYNQVFYFRNDNPDHFSDPIETKMNNPCKFLNSKLYGIVERTIAAIYRRFDLAESHLKFTTNIFDTPC